MNKKLIALPLAGLIALGALTGCSGSIDQRQEAQKQSQSSGESLEIKNLKKKKLLEEKADMLRYVYLFANDGTVIGYHVAKGKISSSGSQIGPESEAIGSYSAPAVVDSAKDDGSYGQGDPGIFFFNTNDVMVEWNGIYQSSDQPLDIDVPRLLK